jgi:hypothetical protein
MVESTVASLCSRCQPIFCGKAYRAAYRAFASVFREASARLRAGDLTAIFPEHCFPPALAYQGAGPP